MSSRATKNGISNMPDGTKGQKNVVGIPGCSDIYGDAAAWEAAGAFQEQSRNAAESDSAPSPSAPALEA